MVRALVIVAHPDDETIWMGGTIIKNVSWEWTIISLCRGDDKDREPKFRRVCSIYGAKSAIGSLEDEKLEPVATKEIKEKIKLLVPEQEYDYIFTHGKNGEYGHIRHKEVHETVREMVKENELCCKKLAFFSYIKSNKSVPAWPEVKLAVPNQKADCYLKLDSDQYEKKIFLITNVYGFDKNSFEVASCANSEAFDYG